MFQVSQAGSFANMAALSLDLVAFQILFATSFLKCNQRLIVVIMEKLKNVFSYIMV